MAINGLHHVMLTVTDFQRSNEFYGGLLGLETFRANPDHGVVGAKVIYSLPDGNFFAIVQHASGDKNNVDEMRTGLDHVSFTCPLKILACGRSGSKRLGYRRRSQLQQPPASSSSSYVTPTISSCKSLAGTPNRVDREGSVRLATLENRPALLRPTGSTVAGQPLPARRSCQRP